MEDVVGWVIGKDTNLVTTIKQEFPDSPDSVPAIVSWLKKETKDKGAKTDFLAHEAITSALPERERQRQNRRNAKRCQATTVSGCTRMSADFHQGQKRRSAIQKSRSVGFSRGRGCFLLRIATC